MDTPAPKTVQATPNWAAETQHDSNPGGDDSPPTDPAHPKPGSDAYLGAVVDGRYSLDEMIGEGGMGVVYRGQHTLIGKKVALKILRGDMARDKEMVNRFVQEAKAASSIGNPHIVDISDFGVLPDGCAYFVMEYLKGASLSAVMSATRPVPVMRLVHIAKQIAQGLSAAHAAGIVHRDLKPDNVFIVERGTDKDFVKILDFGIAKVGSEAARITRTGSVFGTPHYMSPEQAAGADVDHRTDIYSLGVILYEMASGRVPFDADNFMGILTQHMYKAPVPIRAIVPPPGEVPPGLDAIILKCLSKKPESRYASMDELMEDLTLLETGGMPRAVGDMMARSGGFNVPADYFRNPAMQAAVPGRPNGFGKRSRAPLFAALGITGGLLVVVIVILVRLTTTEAHSRDANVPPPPSVATAPTASALAAPPSASASSQAAPATKLVVLAVEPIDAHVTRDGKDLGTSPVTLTVHDGETVKLAVARAGYVAQTVKVDGSEARMAVRLTAVTRPSTTKPATTVKSGSGSSSGDFADPWKK